MTAGAPGLPRAAFDWTACVCAGLMLVVGLLTLRLALPRGGQLYTPDSAHYVEQARSLLAGRGFVSRPGGIDDINARQSPDTLFPPGYPLVIAAGSAVSGAPVEAVALSVSRIALMLLPLAIFVAFRPVIGDYGAACVGILSGLSPGVIGWGAYALTDILALTFVLTSVGLTLAAWSRSQVRSALLLAFGGGVMAGCAYLTRNAHLALLLATSLSMVIWLAGSPPGDRARQLRISLSWALGAAIIVLPWLARNVMVFGHAQPYSMPPSTLSAWWNVRSFIGAEAYDVLGSPYWGTVVGWTIAGLVALVLATIALAYLSSRRWSTLQPGEQRALVFSLIYALLGAAIVIAARTRYQWGGRISERFAVQYTPFVLLAGAVLLRHLSRSKVMLIAMSAAIMVGLIALRRNALVHYGSSAPPIVELVQRDRAERVGPCARDAPLLVVSNYDYLYRILCDANARPPGDGGMGGQSIPDAAASIRSRLGDRPVIVALHPGRGIDSSALPLPAGDAAQLAAQGWMVRENSPLALVLARDRR